jgi:hypothetical protein
MKRIRIECGWALVFLATGCGPGAAIEAPPQETSVPTVQVPVPAEPSRPAPSPANVSGDTPHDLRFAEFVRKTAGEYVTEVAVGIERSGRMQVVLARQTAPEDTLPLTKGLVTGARKDFPDQPFTLVIFDPSKTPILKARFDPGQGVQYQVVQDAAGADEPASRVAGPVVNRAATDSDRRFADWAMNRGRDFLRYVEADLERHGRIWFGVTREVQPADVPKLTTSLLEGASTEFPRQELTATVFDPEGEKIGTATLGADGKVRWSQKSE